MGIKQCLASYNIKNSPQTRPPTPSPPNTVCNVVIIPPLPIFSSSHHTRSDQVSRLFPIFPSSHLHIILKLPPLIPLPKLLPKVLRQPIVRTILPRPPHEPQVQHVDRLPLRRARRGALAEVVQRGGRPALLREGAVEDDGALGREAAAEGGEEGVEGSRGDVLRVSDVASYVVFGVLVVVLGDKMKWHGEVGRRYRMAAGRLRVGMRKPRQRQREDSPSSRTSIMA